MTEPVIHNLSRLKNSRLRPLLKFAYRRAELPYMTTFVIRDQLPTLNSEGRFWRHQEHSGEQVCIRNSEPCLIQLFLSSGGPYPQDMTIPQSPHQIWVDNWEEEIVLVTAHELRHLDQFLNAVILKDVNDENEREGDAERHAYKVLCEFQKTATLARSASSAEVLARYA